MFRFSDLPPELSNDPELVAARREMIIAEIDQTLSLAEVRCLPFDALLKQVEELPSILNSCEVIFRACELELSMNQAFALAESVRRLADKVDELPSRRKQTFDRAIRRILSALPAEAAWPVAGSWLEHKRKFRRETAYSILKRTGVDDVAGARLFEVFESSHDQAALELIARNPRATKNIEVRKVLPLFEENYWRMRLVEAVLIDNQSAAIELAQDYPREFTHAVGRQKLVEFKFELERLFVERSNDLDFISIYGWALGQLGATEQLAKLRKHLDQL